MRLGLKNDEISLSVYTDEWNEEFSRVKKEIIKYTSIKENRIEHIGSTAIKDMLAKPIIDILIAVDDIVNIDNSLINSLKKVGFLRLRVERPNEIIFAKFHDDTYEEKTHFIHLVEYEKELWENLLFFRDYLNAFELARNKYIEIKLDYIRKSTTGINEYTKHKEEFVNEIFCKRKK